MYFFFIELTLPPPPAQVPPDVPNPLLRILCAELKADYEPKTTVHSTREFAGKVWE